MGDYPQRPAVNACPFCGKQDEDMSFYYNGSGPPPSYAVECGWCGARGARATGSFRDDHEGARVAAIKEWNQAIPRQAVADALAALRKGYTLRAGGEGASIPWRAATDLARQELDATIAKLGLAQKENE